jgi:bacteriocin-like protein
MSEETKKPTKELSEKDLAKVAGGAQPLATTGANAAAKEDAYLRS